MSLQAMQDCTFKQGCVCRQDICLQATRRDRTCWKMDQLAAHLLFMDFLPSTIGPLVMLRFSVIAQTNKRWKDGICGKNLPVAGRTHYNTWLPQLSGTSSTVEENYLRKENWVCCRYLHVHKPVPLMLNFLSSPREQRVSLGTNVVMWK